MAAWKWVLEPLRWIIPLRLNFCLNSRSHKLYYSCFIKKQSWWTICLTHYMAELSSKGRARSHSITCLEDRLTQARHGRMRARASPHRAVHQTLMGGPSSPFQVSLQSWVTVKEGKRWPSLRRAQLHRNQERDLEWARAVFFFLSQFMEKFICKINFLQV